jgi:hypothetical protein
MSAGGWLKPGMPIPARYWLSVMEEPFESPFSFLEIG